MASGIFQHRERIGQTVASKARVAIVLRGFMFFARFFRKREARRGISHVATRPLSKPSDVCMVWKGAMMEGVGPS